MHVHANISLFMYSAVVSANGSNIVLTKQLSSVDLIVFRLKN